jgi:hypothetical protein
MVALVVIGTLLATGTSVLASVPARVGPDAADGAMAPPPLSQVRPDLRPDPAPLTIPGTNRTVRPFAGIRDVQPIDPAAMPKGKGGGQTVAFSVGDDVEPEGNLGCGLDIDARTTNRTQSFQTRPGSPPEPVRIADISYTGTMTCNFNLPSRVWAEGNAGVIDRTPRFNGEVLSVGSRIALSAKREGGSFGTVQLYDEWDDHGRRVEAVLELFILSPPGLPWAPCKESEDVHFLVCDGVGSDLLHVMIGTRPFDTGLSPPVVEHVALGESYASGAGVEPYEAGRAICYRSIDAYHGLLAFNFTADGMLIKSPIVRACKGSFIGHMYLPQVGTEGPQLHALSPYTTRLVTISAGGNDLDFGNQLRRCAAVFCTGPLVTSSQLAAVQVQLRDLYRDILGSIRPDGVLVVLGYPRIFPRTQPSTCPNIGWYETPELQAIDDAWQAANNMIFGAALSVGDPRIRFVNMLDAFGGQGVCGIPPHATGATPDVAEFYHPNRLGHTVYADRIRQTLGIRL